MFDAGWLWRNTFSKVLIQLNDLSLCPLELHYLLFHSFFLLKHNELLLSFWFVIFCLSFQFYVYFSWFFILEWLPIKNTRKVYFMLRKHRVWNRFNAAILKHFFVSYETFSSGRCCQTADTWNFLFRWWCIIFFIHI
jgi:hypothetical protein